MSNYLSDLVHWPIQSEEFRFGCDIQFQLVRFNSSSNGIITSSIRTSLVQADSTEEAIKKTNEKEVEREK